MVLRVSDTENTPLSSSPMLSKRRTKFALPQQACIQCGILKAWRCVFYLYGITLAILDASGEAAVSAMP